MVSFAAAFAAIAMGRVARAASDGHTISLATGDQFMSNGALYPLQYDI